MIFLKYHSKQNQKEVTKITLFADDKSLIVNNIYEKYLRMIFIWLLRKFTNDLILACSH